MKLDSQLNFSEHIKCTCSSTIGKVKQLGRLVQTLDKETLLMLYRTLVIPLFDYCYVIYNCLSQKDGDTLQKVQNLALKSILQLPKLTPTTKVQETAKLPLLKRRGWHTCTAMYKVSTNRMPQAVLSMFNPINTIQSRQTRSSYNKDYYVPKVKLNMGKRNFRHGRVIAWKEVPLEMRTTKSLNIFKKHIKRR